MCVCTWVCVCVRIFHCHIMHSYIVMKLLSMPPTYLMIRAGACYKRGGMWCNVHTKIKALPNLHLQNTIFWHIIDWSVLKERLKMFGNLTWGRMLSQILMTEDKANESQYSLSFLSLFLSHVHVGDDEDLLHIYLILWRYIGATKAMLAKNK